MHEPVLHYLYDPLCGWCYGAAPLVQAARRVMPVQAHAGGMMAGSRRQRVSPQLRDYVMPHDRRIGQLTGQPFGAGYTDGLLRDTSAVFDSEPPIAAVLAAERIAGRGLDMLSRLQAAHYVEGRRIADKGVLVEQAAAIGLDPEAFAATFAETEGQTVQGHIAQSRSLMQRVGASGFPSFVLEQGGRFTPVDAGSFFGRPEEFADELRRQAPASAAARPAGGAGCDEGLCAL
ncbi:DsbA family protein [Ideonella sp. YS5]|uniref:DsbA family protein n=1 Tax=Ideonella sp. YS5 TaxID=3453714 RepID=UPI003EEBADD5